VSDILLPLESPENIIVTRTVQSLEVSLPRLHLSFFVNTNGELECRSMTNYVVDKTQFCGTMFGLRNKLILCPRPDNSKDTLLPRRVIIPEGKVSFYTTGDFANVSIDTGAEQHVRWHEYTIDTDLGYLTSNTGLRSKLYQCYLHAITSHCLPDPLLGHTGTEEALHMLRSAACRSFQRLDGSEAKLLELISDLTPKRIYYPIHLKSMATVKWNGLPVLSQHHDFHHIVSSILDHARALETLYDEPAEYNTPNRDKSLLNRAAVRNKSYYPSDLQISEPSSPGDIEYKSRGVSDSKAAEHHVAYRTSWSIWNAQPSLQSLGHSLPNIWDLMNSWGSLGPASDEVSLHYSRYWLEFDAKRDWVAIYNLCRNAVNGGLQSMRIKLSFCLAAAAYNKSKYSDISLFFVVFSLDEHCRSLGPPPGVSYLLSDHGLAPTLACLENLVPRSAVPMQSIPTHLIGSLIKVEEGLSKKARKRRRREKYNAIIKRESSPVANSILSQWPDYGSADFCEQWFSKYECLRHIDEYSQSISRNIQLRDHVLQLQSILQNYRNVSIPATLSSGFSSFFTSHPKAPSYSIHDVFLSNTNVATPLAAPPSFGVIPLTAATAGTIELVGLDSLEILIKELRYSCQPLLELYGNELDKSYRELMGRSASASQYAIPSHELLRLYLAECSHKKEKIFSEISAMLAPSQNVEKANDIAGLWPRITPRSLLRQLAQDRIGALPDRWKAVITRYAVCLLKYQQSKRMLELSSSQKYEELRRETESMRSDVLAELAPDWLLVQVRPLRYRRSD
jgi:hypothetical protein